jgi:hypothetical protein
MGGLRSCPLKIHFWEKTATALTWQQGQRRFQVHFTSLVPKAYKWGGALGEHIQLTISQCPKNMLSHNLSSSEGPTTTLLYSTSSDGSHLTRPSIFQPSSSTDQDSTPPGASTHSSTATNELIKQLETRYTGHTMPYHMVGAGPKSTALGPWPGQLASTSRSWPTRISQALVWIALLLQPHVVALPAMPPPPPASTSRHAVQSRSKSWHLTSYKTTSKFSSKSWHQPAPLQVLARA